jgi:hypothetical protein
MIICYSYQSKKLHLIFLECFVSELKTVQLRWLKSSINIFKNNNNINEIV